MVPSTMIVLAILAAIVLAPLVREYADLRSSFGLTRLGALATTFLVLPAFAVAAVLALPLSAHPVAQWLTTVATTVVVYSLAAQTVSRPALSREPS